MSTNAIMPLFPSQDLPATETFYTSQGFQAVLSGPDYLQLSHRDKPDVQLGFFRPKPDHPLGMFRVTDAGAAFLSIEVDDVDEQLAAARRAGHLLAIPPRQEPWGQRHFAIVDPNGILVDFNKMEPFAAPEAA